MKTTPITGKMYGNVLKSLQQKDDSVKKLSYASKFYLVYQVLMDLFSLRNTVSEIEFIILATRKMNHAKKKVVPAGETATMFFHEFWKLGCSFHGLDDETKAKEIFTEIKKRRNLWLKEEKSLHAFLVLENDFETDEPCKNVRFKSMEETFQFENCENFSIELKPGITRMKIEQAIADFYKEECISEKDNFNVYLIDRITENTKWYVTLTIVPALSAGNEVAAFSITTC